MLGKKFLSMALLVGMLISQSVPPALAATLCDHAQFVSDLTAPDGSAFAPGASITKTWRLMNIGTCTWTTAYNLVWTGGDSLGAPLSVRLPVEVLPGQMVDISVNLAAPAVAGHYRTLFKISNTSGAQFGIGESAGDPFWADIDVIQTNAVIYDFVANAPYAQWKSGAGPLPFPGTSGDSRGFAYQVSTPHLEDDSFDPSPGLLFVPQNKFNGYIQAAYPEFQVQSGDRLQTLVNCEFGAQNCYVTFRIDYLLPNGAQKTLWSWREAYDKRFYRADIDLSSLSGQKVRFVFMLLSSGFASGDRALWGSPRIVRAGTSQPPSPPATLTPLPPLPATATPLGQPPPTVAPSGCDRAAFITDVTVPDGTTFAPGAAFTKTWRLKNIGACTWTTAYKLMYYSGDLLGAPAAVNLPWNVGFDQTVDISVNMVAPAAAGKYRGFWILSNASGQLFGIGADASRAVWVEINVAGEAPVASGYDFTSNVCSAEWKSGAGILPCPGTNGNSSGFIIKLDTPKMEDGSTGAPSLLAAPQNRYNGYIQGFYPTFTVQPGDRFQTTIGCEFGVACYLTYRLDYMTANGYIGTFWQWREQNEGRVHSADIDLSPLAGRSVRFILTILATGSPTNDRALWGSPRIIRAGSAPAPVTPSPSQTPIPPPADWLTYTNATYGFQFKYPPQAQIVEQSATSLKMNLPYTVGTNLIEKYLQMTVRENVNPCLSPLAINGLPVPPETVMINGISFLKQRAAEAGVGHLHEWVAYSTLHNNACISMDFVLHSLNAGNFATPVPEFDKAAESAVFAQIMSTFAWATATVTPVPPTVPPQPPTPSPDPGAFAQSIVDGLNTRNFDGLRAMMDQSFTFAYWESQGFSSTPEQAIENLRNSNLSATPLTPDSAKDFNVLLGGLNPSTIMGLDPSRSQALFVSGWGSDGTGEAILYATQRSDGSLYWYGVLIAPHTFSPVTPTPVSLTGPYAVIGVAGNDVLNIRSDAGVSHPVVGSFAWDAVNVMRTGPTASADNAAWVEVQRPDGGTGWVNSYYLTEYVSHDTFCADTRIPALIEQLKGSMNQSSGEQFAGLVSPVHGVDVRLWAYHAPVSFSTAAARVAFTSSEVYVWGSGSVGGTEFGTGTFAEVIQPRMLEVFNASNMETYCDNLTRVFPLQQPWPYSNIRYYNLYKPATPGTDFDFRTWLIGFEYIDNQPYLYSMVSVVWEP